MSIAFTGADIFDGETTRADHALLVKDGRVALLCPMDEIPSSFERRRLPGGLIAPGFVDMQVNGGGGTLFNETPTVDGIRRICAAHARFGSTALLPTVITDRPEITFAAIAAVEAAMAEGVPGCAGIHVEGPFIAPSRKGAHDPALIRRMEAIDLEALRATSVRPFLITVAPESVSDAQIAALVSAGIRVSIGHSDADYETALSAFAAGASCVTHLFNAMSPMNHRKPGLVGAALASEGVWCGVIPDGHHVHPAVLSAALRAKKGARKLAVVSDAMPTVGSSDDRFVLNGRLATRRDGRLTLDDGTLAGSDLSMIGALHHLVRMLEVPLEEALRMCALYPAECLGIDGAHGRLARGMRADMVWIDADLALRGVWIGGMAIAPDGGERNRLPFVPHGSVR